MQIVEESNIVMIAITSVILAAILGLSIFHISDRSLMAANIESAINKGINPMSVRCSYVRGDDPICIAYAASRSEDQAVQTTSSKK